MNSSEQAQAIGANPSEAQKRILAEFGGKFAESPAYAFEWSASTFDAAARAEVLGMTLGWSLRSDRGDGVIYYRC